MLKFVSAILAAFLLAAAPALFAEPLDINTATEEQLDEVLVGVGKAKAKAIVADREKNGNFKSVDDLKRVKGIGAATLEKNRSKIAVGPDSAVPAVAKPAATLPAAGARPAMAAPQAAAPPAVPPKAP